MTKLQKVLVVDTSRLVRASLGKLLGGHFEVCEERDHESAWQTLVLDSSIIAVFSGLDISTIEGAGLVERLRASKLARLNLLPFYQLVSDSFVEGATEKVSTLGVTEFIPKRSAGPEFQRLLLRLVKPDSPALPDSTMVDADYGEQSELGLNDFKLSFDDIPDLGSELSTTAISSALRMPVEAGDHSPYDLLSSDKNAQSQAVLVFGLDDYENIRLRYGWDLADKIVQKILGLLASKFLLDESMLPLVGGRIAIISSMAGLEECEKFAVSVCKAMSVANVSMRGERISATVSAGIAALPEDSVASNTDELLRMAISRHSAAVLYGGNRVICTTGCSGDSINQQEFFERMKVLLQDESPDTMLSCKGWISVVCKKCRISRAAGEAPFCASINADEEC